MVLTLCYLLTLLGFVQFRATVDATPVVQPRKDLKIICHYHLNTWYAPGYRDYLPEVIDESQCTHIVYNDRVRYSDLEASNRSLHDGKILFYDRVPQLRKKGINVSISFFKFNGYEYAKILGDSAENRTQFVEKLVGFMERNQFNGFDFFWGCRSCSKENSRNASDDKYLMELVRELSEAFKPRGWLLSTFVSRGENVVNNDFNVKELSEYVDWMAYHPLSMPENYTTLLAPLYFYPGDVQEDSTLNSSINYLVEKGVPPQKIVLTISSRGQPYRLQSAENNDLNAPAELQLSEYFYEVCQKVKNVRWNVVHDADKRIGTYAYHEQEWISYNDVEDVQHKAEYIIQNKLGGGSISNSNYDDFEGKCECGKSPLQRALSQALRNETGPKLKNCT